MIVASLPASRSPFEKSREFLEDETTASNVRVITLYSSFDPRFADP